ncbi:MAG: uracil-DNA glycosylase [bacterium]|nr:uracil-DNA glycosylase [bacterium]MDE0602389.1 uracil-DNA glycosylase [bacterium]
MTERDLTLTDLAAALVECRKCERLVSWREKVATEKRAAYRGETYWGRPVPGFGDPGARLVLVGLAPAAHGANRTGRMFTGDRSGDWLYRALHRAGFANQASSAARDDGLKLRDCWVTASVRCAPPGNRPLATETANCSDWLVNELSLFKRLQVLVALGGFSHTNLLRIGPRLGWSVPRPRPAFGHAVVTALGDGPVLVSSYHPSQQNTFTGRLTEEMFDRVFALARQLLEG